MLECSHSRRKGLGSGEEDIWFRRHLHQRLIPTMLIMDARYLQHRLPPDARASIAPRASAASRFARFALSRVLTTSRKREEIPVPIGGSFVVAAPLGLHAV